MNFCILLFLSFIILAKSSEIGFASTPIISRIKGNSKCSLSNSNFTDAFHLNELCTQPLLSVDDYKSRLVYNQYPLLCAEYFVINSYFCNLTKHGNHAKNISVPNDKSGVDDFLIKLRNKRSNIKEFCNFTRERMPNFSSFILPSDLKGIDDYFKVIVGNESTCIRVCKNILNDSVADLCNIIIWAQLRLTDSVLPPEDDKGNIKPLTDETFIEKIPNQDSHQDLQAKDHKVVSKKEFENNLKAPSIKVVLENSEKPSERSNIESSKIGEEIHQSPSIVKSTKNNEKVSEVVENEENFVSPNLEQTGLTYALSNNVNSSNLSQLVPQLDKKQETSETKYGVKKAESGAAVVDDNDNDGGDNNGGDGGGDDLVQDDKFNDQNFQLEKNDVVSGQDALRLNQENAENKKFESDGQTEDNFMSSIKQSQDSDLIDGRASFQSPYRDVNDENSHFFVYFVSMGIVCGVLYILFHNKKKILALAVEGRRGRPHGGGRRRPNTAAYSKLDSNLEEAMVSNVSQASVTHVLY